MSQQLIDCIIKAEGVEQFAYEDSLGFITIGCGRCIDKKRGKGLSREESLYLLNNDIKDCKLKLSPYPFYQELDPVRKEVLAELCFNLGIGGLLGFKRMIAAIQSKDFIAASLELLDSKWATQIQRSRRTSIAYRLKYGIYPT